MLALALCVVPSDGGVPTTFGESSAERSCSSCPPCVHNQRDASATRAANCTRRGADQRGEPTEETNRPITGCNFASSTRILVWSTRAEIAVAVVREPADSTADVTLASPCTHSLSPRTHLLHLYPSTMARRFWTRASLLTVLVVSSLVAASVLLGVGVSGEKIADCCCELETIDLGNDEALYQNLQKLRVTMRAMHDTCDGVGTVTRFSSPRCARAILRPSPSFASSKSTSTMSVPSGARIFSVVASTAPCAANAPMRMSVERVCTQQAADSGDGAGTETHICHSHCLSLARQIPAPWRIPTTDPVDRTLMGDFRGWQDRDESLWIVQDESDQISYINMQLNPEGYTGYEGFAPHRIWNAIYAENCFTLGQAAATTAEKKHEASSTPFSSSPSSFASAFPKPTASAPSPFGAKEAAAPVEAAPDVTEPPFLFGAIGNAEFESLCYEQRVLYRLLSGMHASISSHIANSYPVGQVDPSIDIHASSNGALIGANVTVFQDRVGRHPDRLNNMYFAFVFLLRAVNKARDTLRVYDYGTGNVTEDTALRRIMSGVLESPLVTSCSSTASFDESTMFATPAGRSLRTQLRGAFRNISRIMDCVGCEKCKLHGKLQILGLGTALKILFNEDESALRLERNEVMALLVTLSKLSHSLRIAQQMEARVRAGAEDGVVVRLDDVPATNILLPFCATAVALAVATVILFVLAMRRRRNRAATADDEAAAAHTREQQSTRPRVSDITEAASAADGSPDRLHKRKQ